MQLTGERFIAAPRQTVWQALNDPDVLHACIPGCEQLEKTSDTGFVATVAMKVGPVKARMEGAVTLEDIDAPNSYRINGKGKGAAGFASGDARVSLSDHEGQTQLKYVVDAKIGGKLAEVGARFIDSTAQKMADQFFDAFAARVIRGGDAAPAAAAARAPAPAAPKSGGTPVALLVALAALAAAAAWYFFG